MYTSLTRVLLPAWLPWLLLLGVCAVLQAIGGYPALRLDFPPTHGTWVYTVFSCHLVHLTTRHWLSDSLALLVIGWIFVDAYNWKNWLLTCCLSALSVSVGLLMFHPGLRSYAGLSGVLHGLFTMGCLLLMPRQPRLAVGLMLLLLLKLLLEPFYGSLFMPTPGFTVASLAHVYGMIGGLLSWLTWISVLTLRSRHVV